jgi:AcrR family transcriptional regulator
LQSGEANLQLLHFTRIGKECQRVRLLHWHCQYPPTASEIVSAPNIPRPTRIDGRRLRSERTKQLIIEAYLALLRENTLTPMPTAAEIAERAGYSVRSIFERFPDLHTLRVAAADYGLAHAAALAPARHVDADRPTRIKSQVETRAGTCERGVALWRALTVNVDEDDALKLRLRIARERTVDRIEIMYRPELATLSEIDRKNLLIALEALTDMESWARMREMHGLSFAESCAVWTRAIDRMLPSTPI